MVTYGHVVMDSQEDYSMQRWTAHRQQAQRKGDIYQNIRKKNKAINLNTSKKEGLQKSKLLRDSSPQAAVHERERTACLKLNQSVASCWTER